MIASPRLRLTIGWLLTFCFGVVFLVLIASPALWEHALRSLFPSQPQVLFTRVPLGTLVLEHLGLVGISSAGAIVIGTTVGIFVTRPAGRAFYDIVGDLSSFGQTIPPVAVLALAVPAIGFGVKPTVVALVLYSILPVLRNTIAGIESVPPDVIESAYASGMTKAQVIRGVVVPLALPVIVAGIRISVVINVGTATIGAVVGSGGLGAIIISGLVSQNPAFVLQGALSSAFLALLLDLILANVEKSLYRSYAWNQ